MRALSTAVSWLFVPGDRPERFAKALSSGAHVVVCDLEDAVAPDAKAVARENVVAFLAAGGRAAVRINASGTPWHDADVRALRAVGGLAAAMVPKAEHPHQLEAIAAALGDASVVALIETARGVAHAEAIASVTAVERIAFGSIDYAVDIGADGSDDSLLLARSTLVLASRLGSLPAPVDGVTADFRDAEATTRDARRAHGLGFGGKLCIHPGQVADVAAAFAPTDDEIDWARRVLDAQSDGAVAVDGAMVDAPVRARARRILDRIGPDDDGPRSSTEHDTNRRTTKS